MSFHHASDTQASTHARISDLRRRRRSLYAVLLVFLFVFAGLFAGFVIAHVFPETVLSLAYGVRTGSTGASPLQPGPSSAKAAEDADAGVPAPSAASGQPLPKAEPAPAPRFLARDSIYVARTKPPLPVDDDAKPQEEPVAAVVATAERSFVKLRQKPAPPVSTAGFAPGPQGALTIAPAQQQPVSAWTIGTTPGGFLDQIILVSTGQAVGQGQSLSPDDVIEAQGWAGDVVLGMRFEDVLIAVCDKIVARGRIEGSRPDVAQNVHPNLTLSGWRVRLFVGHLPRCAEPRLEAFAIVPGSSTLFRLNNASKLPLPAAIGAAAGGLAPFTPKDVRPLRTTQADILETTELRRCGRADCQAVALAQAGTVHVSMQNEAGDWVLVLFPDKAGWMPRSKIKPLP